MVISTFTHSAPDVAGPASPEATSPAGAIAHPVPGGGRTAVPATSPAVGSTAAARSTVPASSTAAAVAAREPDDERLARYWVAIGTGLAAGFLGSLMGIGGGVVVVPALRICGGFTQKVAQGMSLLYVVPAALYSAILYRVHAHIRIDTRRAVSLIVGGLVGAFGGTFFVKGIRDVTLTWIFAAALALLGILIVVRGRRERGRAPAPVTEEQTA
jgi:hypothetical protein